MYTQHHGFSFLSAKAFFHNFSPYAAGSTEFSNFFQYVVVSIPEEGQTACESVNVHTSFDSSFYVVGTAQRVDGVSQAGFVRNDLLSTQSDGNGFSGRQSQSFVLGVGVQGLGATHNSCCSL